MPRSCRYTEPSVHTSYHQSHRLAAAAIYFKTAHKLQRQALKCFSPVTRLLRFNKGFVTSAAEGLPNMAQNGTANGTAVQQSRSRSGLLVAKEMLDDKLSHGGKVSIHSMGSVHCVAPALHCTDMHMSCKPCALICQVQALTVLMSTISRNEIMQCPAICWEAELGRWIYLLPLPVAGRQSHSAFRSGSSGSTMTAQAVLTEFDRLRRMSLGGSVSDARSGANVRLNRYTNVVPYNSNRVRLQHGSTDYINASMLESPPEEQPGWRYIATQVNGCLLCSNHSRADKPAHTVRACWHGCVAWAGFKAQTGAY